MRIVTANFNSAKQGPLAELHVREREREKLLLWQDMRKMPLKKTWF